ncbi:MAG: nickel-dependent lactate racemase, partial [Candidatus Njordarchaeota archaeon]
KIPYGKDEVEVTIPDKNFMMVVWPKEVPGSSDPVIEIKKAMDNPIGTKKLEEIARPGDKVAIVVDDATRPAPTYLMLPPILEKLHKAGVQKKDITIIFATGTHRDVTPEEAKKLLGDKIASEYKWINHNCDAPDLVYKGTTKYGTPIYINRIYDEADVKIITGDITLHYYAGFGGGRKSILPGVSGRKTIQHNHAMLFDPNARAGLHIGNPISEDMTEAARLAGVDFMVNVVINSKKEIVKAYAGDFDKAFVEGIKFVEKMYIVKIPYPADITIASPGGSPLDINLYQAHKAIYFAESATRKNGNIIVLAECPDGPGNRIFAEWMEEYKDLETNEALKAVKDRLKKHFRLGGHKAYYILNTVANYRLYMKSSMDPDLLRGIYRIEPVEDVQQLLNQLLEENPDAKVLVLPFGNETLPVPE